MQEDEMNKELFKAITTNSLKLLEELLQDLAVTGDADVMHEVLQLAMQNDRLEMVEILLEVPMVQQRLDENANIDNNNVLIWAAKNGHLTVVNRLLQISVVAQHAHAQNNFALRFALENAHLEVVQTLLEVSAVAEHAHLDDNWVLQWAIKNNHVLIAKQLLQLSEVKNNIHADNNWILKLAKNKCPELVKTLLELPIPENANANNDREGCALLDEYASKRAQDELHSEYKFELGACALNGDASESDEQDSHQDKFDERLLKLLESVSKVQEKPSASNDNDDHAPAVGMRQKEKKLNESNLDEDASNETKLLQAASGCEESALKEIGDLVAKGVNINFASPHTGTTALHFAAIKGNTEIIQVLTDQNADLRCRDKSGETPLEMAARQNNKGAVMMLLEALGSLSSDIHNVVFIAAKYGNIDLLCALLELGFDVNTVFPGGQTLLGIFVKQRNASAILDLKTFSDSLHLNLDLNQKVPAQNNQRPIVLAIKNEDIEVICALADAGADLSIDGNFPAHLAVFNGLLEIVKLLHARGVVMDKDGDGESPIHTAVERNQLEILKFFKIQALNFDVCYDVDQVVSTPLCRAIFKKNHYLISWLLHKAGASLNGPSYKDAQNEQAPVIAAILNNDQQTLKYLANLGADLALTDVIAGRNLLQEAMVSCSYKCIEFLASQVPIDMEQFYEEMDGIDRTMIGYMRDGHQISVTKTAKALHNLGFDIRRIDPETDLTMTHELLRILAENSWPAVLNNLDLNIKNSKGETPLHRAVLDGSERVVTGLLVIAYTQKDLNIDSMDNKGDTPLHEACKLKSDAIIKKLLNAGAATTILNNKGQTPLDIYPKVKTLLEAKKKAIDTANVTSGNDTAEMKTEAEENTCKLEGDVAINTVPTRSRISESNPPILTQFCNRTNANSTTEFGSSNKRPKIE